MQAPWFESNPERLEFELQALTDAEIAYEIDEDARTAGVLKLYMTAQIDGEAVKLEAIFPDLYPYFRFTIKAPERDLPHHQHPFSKDLCVLGRNTRQWKPGDDTLAAFIQERVPEVFRAGEADRASVGRLEAGAGRPIEEHQAEPFSDYYNYPPESFVLVDGGCAIPAEVAGGELILAYEGQSLERLRGAVLAVFDREGIERARSEAEWQGRFRKTMRIPWIRVGSPIRTADQTEFYRIVAEQDPRVQWRGQEQLGEKGRFNVVGVLFPEEHTWRDRGGTGWAFVVGVGPKDPRSRLTTYYLARALRGGRADLAARVPELAPLAEKTVAVIGLGGLGASSAIEFARSGVGTLRVLDFDFVDPGTTVRWPLGLPAAGRLKVGQICDHIRTQYPYVSVHPHELRIGSVRENLAQAPDQMVLEEMLNGASLIYDATAELGIQYLLSDLARERGIPYVAVSATEGGWGGLVFRVVPGTPGGCWFCLQESLGDSVPLPPRNATEAGTVQPKGCADPTFTGAGFDLATVAMAGVRMAVSTLCAPDGGYPDHNGDALIITIRDPGTGVVDPSWRSMPIPRSPGCPVCR
jgi:molybdopterin/thiamine biosynthesis adenylyltransferase